MVTKAASKTAAKTANKKTPIAQALSNAAAVVREEVRNVRDLFPTEYVHTTVEHVVNDLEERYPAGGKGAAKLRLARTLLGGILGKTYVSNKWEFVAELIAGVVDIRKSATAPLPPPANAA